MMSLVSLRILLTFKVLLSGALFSTTVFANNIRMIPGAFDHYLQFSKAHNQAVSTYIKSAKRYKKRPKTLPYKVHPLLLQSVRLYSPPNHLRQTVNDRCDFWYLLQVNYFKISKKWKGIIPWGQDKQGTEKWSTRAHLQTMLKKKCPAQFQRAVSINRSNSINEVIQGFPKALSSSKDCSLKLLSISRKIQTAYVCHASKKSGLKGLSSFWSDQLKSYCQAQDLYVQICKKALLTEKTKELRGIKTLPTKIDEYYKEAGIPSLKKMASASANKCHNISKRLTGKNILYTCLQLLELINERRQSFLSLPSDSPLHTPEWEMLLTSRVLSFFSKEFTSKGPYAAYKNVYQFLALENLLSLWPFKICNSKKKKSFCQYYIPGNGIRPPEIESRALARMIKLQVNTSEDIICKRILKKDYKPTLLEYRNGCFVIESDSEGREIIYNRKKVTFIEYKVDNRPNFYPSTYTKNSQSLFFNIKKSIGLKEKTIRNFTELKSFLTGKEEEKLVITEGCLEDIRPLDFNRYGPSNCTKTGIIIEKIIGNGHELLVTTTDTHIKLPLRIEWSLLYNTITKIAEMHSSKLWPLKGLSK